MQLPVAIVVGCYQGAELDIALTAEDYQVTVSDLPCPVVHLTRTLLSCHIDASTYVGLHRAAVRVSVAASLEHRQFKNI